MRPNQIQSPDKQPTQISKKPYGRKEQKHYEPPYKYFPLFICLAPFQVSVLGRYAHILKAVVVPDKVLLFFGWLREN